MTGQKPIPFAGADEELEKYLLEFARLTGGWTRKDGRKGGWVVFGGAWGSTNPNTVARTIRVARAEEGLTLETVHRPLPWAKAKVRRIAQFRESQLADYLTARVRGSGPEKFDALRLREPFAPYGAGVAALTASFAWAVMTGLAAFIVTFPMTILATFPLMAQTIRGVAAHSAALQQAGAIPLPSSAEAASISPWGAAVIFAFPLAF